MNFIQQDDDIIQPDDDIFEQFEKLVESQYLKEIPFEGLGKNQKYIVKFNDDRFAKFYYGNLVKINLEENDYGGDGYVTLKNVKKLINLSPKQLVDPDETDNNFIGIISDDNTYTFEIFGGLTTFYKKIVINPYSRDIGAGKRYRKSKKNKRKTRKNRRKTRKN